MLTNKASTQHDTCKPLVYVCGHLHSPQCTHPGRATLGPTSSALTLHMLALHSSKGRLSWWVWTTWTSSRAVERVLDHHPEWRGKLVLIQVTNAPRLVIEVTTYSTLQWVQCSGYNACQDSPCHAVHVSWHAAAAASGLHVTALMPRPAAFCVFMVVWSCLFVHGCLHVHACLFVLVCHACLFNACLLVHSCCSWLKFDVMRALISASCLACAHSQQL